MKHATFERVQAKNIAPGTAISAGTTWSMDLRALPALRSCGFIRLASGSAASTNSVFLAFEAPWSTWPWRWKHKGTQRSDWTLRSRPLIWPQLPSQQTPWVQSIQLLPLWCGQFLTSRRSIYPLFWGALHMHVFADGQHLAPVDVDQGRYVFITNWLQTKLGRILFLQLYYHLSHEKKNCYTFHEILVV